MNDLISIIVPVYKVEKYLNRCVDSILNQTYRNLEIILVDDGSPDRCGEICDEYSRLDDRVKVIHKENGGLSDARNAGIHIAQGEFFSFVDSDDWVHQEYIERMHELLKISKADISVCNFLRTSKEEEKTEIIKTELHEFSNLEGLKHLSGRFYVQLVVAWGKLYHRELFKEIRFPFGKIHEDEFTTYKLIYEAKKIVLTTEQLLYYWQRKDSIMGRGFDIKSKLDLIEAFEGKIEFFKNIGEVDLVAKTYRSLFNTYKTINDNIHAFNEINNSKGFKSEFKTFRNELRQSKQSIIFRIYYELYYKTPKMMTILHKLYVYFKDSYFK